VVGVWSLRLSGLRTLQIVKYTVPVAFAPMNESRLSNKLDCSENWRSLFLQRCEASDGTEIELIVAVFAWAPLIGFQIHVHGGV
jgi:hypothetical protein